MLPAILSYSRSVDEFVKLGTLKSLCLALLTYCDGALYLSAIRILGSV